MALNDMCVNNRRVVVVPCAAVLFTPFLAPGASLTACNLITVVDGPLTGAAGTADGRLS